MGLRAPWSALAGRAVLLLACDEKLRRDVLTALDRSAAPARPQDRMNRRVGLLLTPVAYGGAVALANVRAVPDAAPAPGDDVVLAGARSQLSR